MDLKLGDTRLIINACKAKGVLRNQCAYVLATALDVRPALALKDETDEGTRDTLCSRDGILAFPLSRHAAHIMDVGLFHARRGVRLAVRMAALLNHIGRVVQLRPQEQMGGVYAGRVVARVADAHPSRNAPTVRNLPRNHVRIGQSLRSAAATYLAVTLGMPPSHPRPALIYPADSGLCVKALFQWNNPFHAHAVAQERCKNKRVAQ